MENGREKYGTTLMRLHKGDSLTLSMTPLNREFSYEWSGVTKGKAHMDAETRSIENVHVNFLLDKVEKVLYKKSDLAYTAPTSENTLNTVSNIKIHFFDKSGDRYPIFEADDISFSLEFTTGDEK